MASIYIIFDSVDVNECVGEPCGLNANCTNTIGSFMCACQAGYEGNGTNCTGTVYVYLTVDKSRLHSSVMHIAVGCFFCNSQW